MKTHIYLIRHGESFANVENIFAGMRSDTGLTLLGVTQAERLRDRLAATGEIVADALIASTLRRAMQTAEIVAPALGLDIIPDDDFHELRVGEADGLRLSEYIERYGPIRDFREEPYYPLAPGGESWGGFLTRVGDALHRITREYEGKTVAIVCHGGVVDASLLIGLGMVAIAPAVGQFHTHNTSITEWERGLLTAASRTQRWRLIRYNDDLHIRDIGAAERFQWTRVSPIHPEGAPAAPLPTEEDDQA
ncbi:MAG TPA: histidine phosphatase family protein [Ktedonobacterales bacterium]|nr:histidine phosphatase family protein [Ktedonobacterales bacterium]